MTFVLPKPFSTKGQMTTKKAKHHGFISPTLVALTEYQKLIIVKQKWCKKKIVSVNALQGTPAKKYKTCLQLLGV